MATKSNPGGRKQFPLNTKGCCFICLKLEGNQKTTSLLDLCKYFKISLREIYEKSLSSRNLPASTAAEQFEKAEISAQLCPSCSRLIVQSIECYQQLEAIKIKRNSYLMKILECFVEAEVYSNLMEKFNMMMAGDKFALPYLGIVTELRKQIEVKCSSKVPGANFAVPVKQRQPERKIYKPKKAVESSKTTPRNIKIKESQVITVSAAPVPSETYIKVEDSDDDGLETPKEEIKEETVDLPMPSPPTPEEIEICDDYVKVEDIHEAKDPLEESTSVASEKLSQSSYPSNPTISGTPTTRSGFRIPCKLCKAELSCNSFQDLRLHYSAFHPNVKLAIKCALCNKMYRGKHVNCTAGPPKPTRAERMRLRRQAAKEKAARENPPAPSKAKSKRKLLSSSGVKRIKAVPPEKKKLSGAAKSEIKAEDKVESDADTSDPSLSTPTLAKKFRRDRAIDPSQYEILPDSTLKCRSCQKIFGNKSRFRKHYQFVHLKQRHYLACDLCDDKFTKRIYLLRHKEVIHLGIGEYQKNRPGFLNVWRPPTSPDHQQKREYRLWCKFGCGKLFRHHTDRTRHQNKVHLGVKYMCDICGKCLLSDTNLVGHKRAVHGIGAENLTCDVCGQAFASKYHLTKHKRAKHGGLMHSCEVPGCLTKVKWKSNLNEHMKKFHSKYLEEKKAAAKCQNEAEATGTDKQFLSIYS